MDTVEWGTRESSPAPKPPRRARRWRTPIAWWLAGGGGVLAVVAEVLPWTSTPAGVSYQRLGNLFSAPAADPAGSGLSSLDATSVLAYHVAWLALLGLAGLMLAGPATVRRAVGGATLGVAVAQVMLLAGDIRWIMTSGVTASTDPSGSLTFSGSHSAGVGPGVFCAGLGVGLIVAATVLSMRRPALVTPAEPALVRPDQFDRLDEPVDLTVTAVDPVEVSVSPVDPFELPGSREEPLYPRADRR
jgi:hypothetical protein